MSENLIHISGMPYFPGVARGVVQHRLDSVTSRSILIISQSDILSLTTFPAGFIVVEGAPLSHTMINLLGYGIPTVIVSAQDIRDLKEGIEIWLDGVSGQISNHRDVPLSPTQKTLETTPGNTVMTADGKPVSLRASVRSIEAARLARAAGVESIGLVRSEFFLPEDGSVPDVQFYQKAFGTLCEVVSPLPVTIRLLDVAPDKIPHGMLPGNIVAGALGMQGVRLFNTDPIRSMLDAQLMAINELRKSYDIRLLIPFLVRREELDYWVKYIKRVISGPVTIGAMVETPAAALDFNNWQAITDFIAIGCNDLMQCLFAADRERPELRQYLDPYAPLLFRFLKGISPANTEQLSKIQLCGVLSQLPGVLPILLGLGYRVFSVDASLVPYLAQTIQSTTIKEAEELAEQVCTACETQQILELLSFQTERTQSFIKLSDNPA